MPELKEAVIEAVKFNVTPELNMGFGLIEANKYSEAEAYGLALQASRHLVPVSDQLPSSCIDGRPSIKLLSGDQSEPRPSVAGGAGITAWAAREMLNAQSVVLASPAETYETVVNQLESKAVPTGGHCDSDSYKRAFEGGKTGCGAADKAKDIIDNLANQPDFISANVSALLEDYDEDIMRKVLGSAIILSDGRRLEHWKGADMLVPLKDMPQRTEELYSDDSETHGHNEQMVVFNYNAGTTIDRDRLVSETDKQIFNVDMWYLRELAKAAATDQSDELEMLHAMAAYQVATYITLCNGSHRAAVLTKA